MKKFDVQIALEGIAEAKGKWSAGMRKFNDDVDHVMARLLHEAAANFMSVNEVAQASGLTTMRVRKMMRDAGLDPRKNKTLLAKSAADALQSNADLLGIEPHEMDLTSPLAYLPMGDELRQRLLDARVHRVTELPEDEVSGNLVCDCCRGRCACGGKRLADA